MDFFRRLDAAGGPPRARNEQFILTSVGLLCAFASSAAFFLHHLGWVRMPFFVNFFGMPAIVLMLVLCLYSWQRRLPFWQRLRAGLIAGTIGLVAYDLIRFLIYKSGFMGYDPFHVIPKLGALITGLTPEAPSSIYAGWGYHIWNGYSFAVIYALAIGPIAWGWGVAWALILETAMLISYPSLMSVKFDAPFIIISFVGHIVYGTILGLTVRRFAPDVSTMAVPA
jgi:hypothetical protein